MISRPWFYLCFSAPALITTVLVFAVEYGIARFFHDPVIRFFGGDVLVMLLMYAFLRIFLQASAQWLSLALLVFACMVEMGQYFHLAARLGLAQNSWGEIILGATFDWKDLLAYLIGTGLNLWITPYLHPQWGIRSKPPTAEHVLLEFQGQPFWFLPNPDSPCKGKLELSPCQRKALMAIENAESEFKYLDAKGYRLPMDECLARSPWRKAEGKQPLLSRYLNLEDGEFWFNLEK
jgi:hypothetical protein